MYNLWSARNGSGRKESAATHHWAPSVSFGRTYAVGWSACFPQAPATGAQQSSSPAQLVSRGLRISKGTSCNPHTVQ